MPLVHVSPYGHSLPQLPQFASSVIGSLHVPLQLFSVASQHASPVPVVGGLHVSPVPHVVPHVPQFTVSFRLLHVPLQFVSPVPQHTAGFPAVQLSPIDVSHVVPHVPQFASSVCGFVHEPLQQLSLDPHAFVHEPQCATSLDVSTHVPLQLVCPAGQHSVSPLSVWHVPVPQSLPHAPQFWLLLRSTHVPPQFVWPVGQHTPL
jgi:hypothetical protein